MIVIDKISFLFGMVDEPFARELYADWDRFCQRCVTEILEEYFSRYDNKETYIEIDRLDLDLGGISQEEFYDFFPMRLREALEYSFTRKLKETELHITDTERALEDSVQPRYIEIQNAGLCLLAIWFSRLFDMLGLLREREDGRKELKNTEAQIRAIFLLQRLVTDEKREYREQELVFNRILTRCPFHVPLPGALELTSWEIQIVESMLAGVKANWDKLKNTSVKGFQRSFIERSGTLEQREEKWVLYVENRAYDILLDSLPWSYQQIQLPWLEKKINVVWRDKENFDFEKYND